MVLQKKESNGQQVTAIKPWPEMTEAEIIQLKRQQCKKCVYYSRGCSSDQRTGTCQYSEKERHSRGCSPLECKTKGKFRPKAGRGEKDDPGDR